MATTIAEAWVSIRPDMSKFQAEIPRAIEGSLKGVDGKPVGKRFGEDLSTGVKSSGISETFKGLFAFEALKSGAGELKGFFAGAIGDASNLSESLNAINVVFEGNAKSVLEFGKNSAESVGLSQRAFNELATPLAALLKNSGVGMDKLGDSTIALTKRAADMASTFNTSVPDALQAITAGLRGETDPLERYGVSLSAARIEAKALADTGKKTAESLTDQEKAAARMALIFEQTAGVEGDFANTSDGLANKQRILKSEMENFHAHMAEKFLPVMEQGLGVFMSLPEPVQMFGFAVSEVGGPLVKMGAGLATAMPGLAKMGPAAVSAASKFVPAVRAMGLAMLTPPLGIVVALVAAGVAVYLFRDQIKDALGTAADFVVGVAGDIKDAISDGLSAVLDFVGEHWPEIATLLSGPFAPIVALATDAFGVRSALEGAVEAAVGFVGDRIDDVVGFFMALPGRAVRGLEIMGDAIIDFFSKLPGRLVRGLEIIGETILNFFSGLPARVFNALDKLGDTINGFVLSLPGRIFNALNQLGDAINGFWLSVPGRIANALTIIGDKLYGFFAGVPSRIFNALESTVGSIIEFFTKLPGRMIGALGDVGRMLWDIGRQLINGLINGMKEKWGDLKDWLSRAIREIPQRIRDFFHLGSPSRLMKEIGENIVEGLAIGLQGAGKLTIPMPQMAPVLDFTDHMAAAFANVNAGAGVGPSSQGMSAAFGAAAPRVFPNVTSSTGGLAALTGAGGSGRGELAPAMLSRDVIVNIGTVNNRQVRNVGRDIGFGVASDLRRRGIYT